MQKLPYQSLTVLDHLFTITTNMKEITLKAFTTPTLLLGLQILENMKQRFPDQVNLQANACLVDTKGDFHPHISTHTGRTCCRFVCPQKYWSWDASNCQKDSVHFESFDEYMKYDMFKVSSVDIRLGDVFRSCTGSLLCIISGGYTPRGIHQKYQLGGLFDNPLMPYSDGHRDGGFSLEALQECAREDSWKYQGNILEGYKFKG